MRGKNQQFEQMVLWLIGLGLGNEDDITEAGLAAVKKCTLIFLEAYTSVLGVDRAKLEAKYGKSITLAEVCCFVCVIVWRLAHGSVCEEGNGGATRGGDSGSGAGRGCGVVGGG